MSFRPITDQTEFQIAVTAPNSRLLLLCHAARIDLTDNTNSMESLRTFIENTLAAFNSPNKVHLYSLDIDKFPDVAKQLEIDRVPVVFAFFNRHATDTVTPDMPREAIWGFLHNFVKGQIVGADNAALPPADATCRRWLTIASDLMKKGNVLYASKMFEKTLLAATTDEVVREAREGVVLCGVIQSKSDSVVSHVDVLRESGESSIALCVYDLNVVLGGLDAGKVMSESVSVKSVTEELSKNPKDVVSRVRLVVLHVLGGLFEEALTEVVKVVTLDKEVGRKCLGSIRKLLGHAHPLIVQTQQFLDTASLT
eukprot:PhF_6_TR41558/c0_g1_i1/m.62955/K05838/ybbN; putative thioredoxin